MRYLVNLTDEILTPEGMTIGRKARMPLVNPEMLDWPDVKKLLLEKKIRIEDPAKERESSPG